MRIITMPLTTSPRPSRVTAPWRIIGARWTRATSAIRTGVPSSRVATTTCRMSSRLVSSPSPRTMRCSPAWTMVPPPVETLFRSRASVRSPRPRPKARREVGSTWTSKVFSSPPKTLSSTTPGTDRTSWAMSQSRISRSSMRDQHPSAAASGAEPGPRGHAGSPRTSKAYISPSALVSGPISGTPCSGAMEARASDRRSCTCWRAKYKSVPSSKTSVTADRPLREMLRTSSRAGSPLIAASTGKVTKRSTSSGPRAGAWVSTCTWTLVMSGTASMGSSVAARRPNAATPAVIRTTR